MDRGKGGCQQAATHKVNKPTRAVRAADLTETRRVSRTIPSISPIALPRMRQYYGEKIGSVCQYVRDVGVAGSNPVTPTISRWSCLRHPQPNGQGASDSNHESVAQMAHPLTNFFAWQRQHFIDHYL